MSKFNFKTSWQFDDQCQTIFYVNVEKFDLDWKKDVYFYIGIHGDNSIKEKRDLLLEAFTNKVNCDIFMPFASISENLVGFVDGRHRFSILRDLGCKFIPCVIFKDQEVLFKQRYS